MPQFLYKIKNIFAACICLVLFLGLSGCSQGQGKRYVDDNMRQVNSVVEGRVINVSEIQIKEDPAILNTISGGILGGAAGIIVGSVLDISSSADSAFKVGGAILGLQSGGMNDSAPKTYTATELTIELENGNILLVVVNNQEYFVRGDEVRIVSLGNEKVRVQHQ